MYLELWVHKFRWTCKQRIQSRFLWEITLWFAQRWSRAGTTILTSERERFVHICTNLLWETDLYIFLLVSCEREICTYVYWRPVRERFVHIYASFWWERDLCCTCLYHAAYMYCERERVVYIFFQCPVWERDLYTFVPASGEREICTVHMGTSLLWETDLYIFFRRPVRERVVHVYTSLRLEGELYCIYLYQLTVRERFVHICTSFRWERDLNCTYGYQLTVRKRLFIFVPTYWKREICTYWYQLPVREREICTVLTCTSLL